MFISLIIVIVIFSRLQTATELREGNQTALLLMEMAMKVSFSIPIRRTLVLSMWCAKS